MEISEDYVSFEIAKLIKEKGFHSECHAYYTSYANGHNEFHISEAYPLCLDFNNDGEDYETSVPTLQMTMKWLREVHKIFITISVRFSNNADDDINFSYLIKDHNEHTEYDDGEFISYEDACEAAIEYSLTRLI